jgi:uncharacterized membrane protein YgcG
MKNFFAALLFLLLAVLSAAAQTERITSFDSRVTVNADSSLQIKETITVEAAGVDIRHGIYRDFPTKYRDHAGNRYNLLFEVVSLSRDRQSEPYRTENQDNGVRVYFGSADYDLPEGEHTYEFQYRTNRQIGFFADHDELYWNVTGNGWKFPIETVSATVVLPPDARRRLIDVEAYTGYSGQKGRAYVAGRDEDLNPTFRAKGLQPDQGLTLVVTWPKGIVAEPTAEQKRAWFIQDNKSSIVGLAGLVLVFFYYLVVWVMVGRDPKHGTIMPLYEPPDNMSPAAVRFVERMGWDEKAFTSAILGLAAKGCLSIEQDDSKTYKLVRKNKNESNLAAEEKALVKVLFEDGNFLVLTNEQHVLLMRARKGLENDLHAALEKMYFVTNSRYLWPGVILSIASIIGMVLLAGGSQLFIAIFMSVWLTGWSFGVYALLSSVVRAWRSVKTEGVWGEGQAGFLTLFSIPFMIGECLGIGMLVWSCGVVASLGIAALITMNIVFHHLLKAPTRAGRALMDRIEGFRMFLKTVDGDRLQTMAPPNKTPELFERLLPYALALDVEHAWSQQFSQILAQAAIGGSGESYTPSSYSPSWYTGSSISAFSAASFTSSFTSSFSSAISSSSAAPGGSSGGGGGGSSGGGGGGGGGGGW